MLKLIRLRQGKLLSCAKLNRAAAGTRDVAESGYFMPDEIGVNPQLLPAAGLVNVAFTVVEKDGCRKFTRPGLAISKNRRSFAFANSSTYVVPRIRFPNLVVALSLT